MKRREFTKTTALAAAALSIPNINFGKAQEEIILGHDKFKYKIVKNWGVDNLVNTPVADCHEMVQDIKKRLIFCTTETKNNIIILDKKGKLIKTWGNEFAGVHGLTLFNANGEEFLFLTDTVKKEVYKTTLDGKILLTLKYPYESVVYNNPTQVPFVPTETAIAPNGDIYVADGYGSSYILVYDSNGVFKNIFAGKFKEGDDKLICAHGVCIDTRDKANPKLIATSREECGFKTYTLDGKHIESTYYKGSFVCRPVIKGDNLYFPVIWSEFANGVDGGPAWQSRTGYFLVFDKNNKLISAPGVDNIEIENGKPKHMHQSAKVKGTFMHCHDLCVDDEENIYIPQWNSSKTFPLKLERI
ncbi:MAG: 6-bladed beta-propeller [Cytophagales bacterium]|nr:MAG: 6-bladed beta-propeller [Cytophagales bacterium]